MDKRIIVTGSTYGIGASVAKALVEAGADESTLADDLVRNAEMAMYAAKDGGKNRIAAFSVDMHVAVLERHGLSGALVDAEEQAVLFDDGKTVYVGSGSLTRSDR